MTARPGELIVPDVVGEVIAWRAWTVLAPNTPHPRLKSATAGATGDIGMQKVIWPTNRWIVAECTANEGNPHHVPPDEYCTCGLYAAKDLEHLLGYGYANWNHDDAPTVIGNVGFAGKVIEGSQGWKAQRGRIVKLFVPFSQGALATKLARSYNVPVEFGPWWATDPRLGIVRSRP